MSAATLTMQADDQPAPAQQRMKILLVDDTPDNLVSLEAALYGLGAELVMAHSGKEALPTVGMAQGEGCVSLGNLLASDAVPERMIAAYTDSKGQPFAERLMRALEAGLAAGGETGDEHGAGLHVANGYDWPVVDLRVDWHEEPIAELRRIWGLYAPQQAAYESRARAPSVAPSF